MTERFAAIAASHRPVATPPPPRLHVEIAQRKAKILLLPGRFRGADHVKRHVDFVLTLDAERGEQHVQRNLRALRRTLDELGVTPATAEREVRRFEGAVRAELWRRVLLRDGDQ
ncbi:DUF6074 family protein [Bradyrhizobium sp. CB82]|uniref:DUF6074 family protein n=1 Tax=Bradyrhizobium sp. CB82 TaxID=3039159 RepID=UPI0024B0B376|nr:DUF6074 family protein [Bradyrhizobium sp. CB82]WFU44116.1 DUF6074 family protein [Bradyrhizobium sp. CB82]